MKNLIVAIFTVLSFLAITFGQINVSPNVNTAIEDGKTKIELTINLDGLSNPLPIRNRQRPNRVTRTRRRARPFTRTRQRPRKTPPKRFTSILITQTPSTTSTTAAPVLADSPMFYYQLPQQPVAVNGQPLYQIVYPNGGSYPFSQWSTTVTTTTTKKPQNPLVENIHDYYGNGIYYDDSYYYYDNEYFSANQIRDVGPTEMEAPEGAKTVKIVQKCIVKQV